MAIRSVHDHDSAEGLLSLDEAREKVLSKIKPLPPIELPLTDAYGCVAAADITAAIDLPEFASSAMDGFAVRAVDVEGAAPSRPVELKVVGRALIGQRPDGPEERRRQINRFGRIDRHMVAVLVRQVRNRASSLRPVEDLDRHASAPHCCRSKDRKSVV